MSTTSAKLGGSAGAVEAYLKDAERTLGYYSERTDGVVFDQAWGLAGARAAAAVIENEAKVARVPIKTPTQVGARTTKTQGSATKRVTADLLIIPTLQFAARPTEATVARGAPPDPHVHVHLTVATMCARSTAGRTRLTSSGSRTE